VTVKVVDRAGNEFTENFTINVKNGIESGIDITTLGFIVLAVGAIGLIATGAVIGYSYWKGRRLG